MILHEIFNKNYIALIGASEYKKILENAIFYLSIEEGHPDKKTMRILISNMAQYIETFSTALWVIKDNSIWAALSTISISNGNPLQTEILRRNSFVTNSSGGYTETSYSELELNEALKYFDVFIKTGKSIDKDFMMIKDGQQNLGEYVTFDAPSFSRALLLLNSARKADILFAKISMYISTLECLLAVDGENTHKVSERVAHFIGNDSAERQVLFRGMKKCYSIRSIYIHGSELKPSKHEGLEDTSFELDKIVRKTFKKLMDQYPEFNYNNKANLEENRLSREQVNDWFDNLVLR